MGIKLEYNDKKDMFRYVDTPTISRDKKGKSIIENPTEYIVLDIETTGLL